MSLFRWPIEGSDPAWPVRAARVRVLNLTTLVTLLLFDSPSRKWAVTVKFLKIELIEVFSHRKHKLELCVRTGLLSLGTAGTASALGMVLRCLPLDAHHITSSPQL